MRKLFIFVISLCLVALYAPSQASSESILARMLRAVPLAELRGNDTVSYIDYAALQKALPNSVRPLSLQEFRELRDADSRAFLWYSNGLGATSVADFSMELADPQVVGFDFYNVDQMLIGIVGQSAARLYIGRFDLAAVQAAFRARQYSARERDGLIVLCGDPDCDADLARRERPEQSVVGNPFDGGRGRREPVALGEGVILSSPDMPIFESMIEAYNGALLSLVQNADVRALLTALESEGSVVQAVFFSADRFEVAEGGIPRYGMAALIHMLQPDGAQPNYIALVYADEKDAQAAAAALPERVEQQEVTSELITDIPQPFFESLAEREGDIAPIRIVNLASRYVLLLPFESPAPQGIPQGAAVSIERPAPLLVFRLLYDALFSGDLGFLAVTR